MVGFSHLDKDLDVSHDSRKIGRTTDSGVCGLFGGVQGDAKLIEPSGDKLLGPRWVQKKGI